MPNPIFQDIAQCLRNQFDKVSLAELGQVQLMDRCDTKCFFHVNQLSKLLSDLSPYYNVLEIADLHCLQYDSLYFDTPDFALYHHHHNHHSNRYKIRFRQYVESNRLTFFEVKQKSNKGRTLKKRVRCVDIIDQLPGEGTPLLQNTSIANFRLQPMLRIGYKRITLVNKDFTERATIDLHLTFDSNNIHTELPRIAIIEVKQDHIDRRSPMMQTLHQHKIYAGSISKYCVGMLFCYPQLKANNFKKTMLRIERLQHLPLISA